jgi:hypothetical protein
MHMVAVPSLSLVTQPGMGDGGLRFNDMVDVMRNNSN